MIDLFTFLKVPASCLKTPHFSILLEKRSKYSKVDINVTIAANDEVIEKLIQGEIDFGFVTQKSDNPVIQHEPFAHEQYTLVGRDRDLVRSISAQSIPEIPFIFYPSMNALLEFWKLFGR